jgi:hypothetical protein
MLYSFLSGFLCTAILFLLCGVVVVGTKSFLVYLKNYFDKPQQQVKPTPPIKKERPKRNKSIEIDADKVDKIFFKKSS